MRENKQLKEELEKVKETPGLDYRVKWRESWDSILGELQHELQRPFLAKELYSDYSRWASNRKSSTWKWLTD